MIKEKMEQIKDLQDSLFVEEHGVTKEQARKLNEFIFNEPTGKEFAFWQGCEVPKPSVSVQLNRLEKGIEDQGKRISELEWEHKKLWMGTWCYIVLSVIVIGTIIAELMR